MRFFHGKEWKTRENVENSVESVYKRRYFADYFFVNKFVTFFFLLKNRKICEENFLINFFSVEC